MLLRVGRRLRRASIRGDGGAAGHYADGAEVQLRRRLRQGLTGVPSGGSSIRRRLANLRFRPACLPTLGLAGCGSHLRPSDDLKAKAYAVMILRLEDVLPADETAAAGMDGRLPGMPVNDDGTLYAAVRMPAKPCGTVHLVVPNVRFARGGLVTRIPVPVSRERP